MECRICHQRIVFVRGLHSGHKRRATLAIHESDAPQIINESRGEVVQPHPGMQRRLRQPLEESHRNQTVPATASKGAPVEAALDEWPNAEPSALADLSDESANTAFSNDVLDTSDMGTVTQVSDAITFEREVIIQEAFSAGGNRELAEELEQYNAVSPELTAGDIDANWQRAQSSGEETPGGHMATPDQDNVDEIARAVGMELQDNQELHTHEELFAKRDRERWELNRNSADGDSI